MADDGVEVDLVGYSGAELLPAVSGHLRITIHQLEPPALNREPERHTTAGVGQAAWQFVRVALRLSRTLFLRIPRPDVVLVQNPPAIPTLAVAVAVARLRVTRLVIDWHNLGHSILALRLGRTHRLVRLTRWLERVLARAADLHLVVSDRMRAMLVNDWHLEHVAVLHDRPAGQFIPLSEEVRAREKARWLKRDDPESARRVGLVVTATSWTLDEDLEMLLEAIERCETRLASDATLEAFPELAVVVTGDGPRRSLFEARLATRRTGRVCIRTCWLPPEDYPRLLASADLGVCMHRSTSGLDLPMKLADMLGCGLPVCAVDYGPVLRERLSEGQNGRCFSTADELANQILELFDRFPEATRLSALRASTLDSDRTSWEDGWKAACRAVVLPR